MRLGIAEINQHPVAHILGDKAAKAGDGVGDAAMIGADDLAQILGIEAGGQRRRTDQIAEHDGQLPPLGLGPHPSLPRPRGRVVMTSLPRTRGRVGEGAPGCGFGDGLRCSAAEGSDRCQQFAAMPDRRNAEPGQIIRRQLGQHLAIDVVGRKGLGILPETEPSQPVGDIERHCLPR
jgi:hypothetical protein